MTGRAAQRLYHEFAAELPVIDYHCHLPPDQIAGDILFENMSRAWLNGDHYKWRAMLSRFVGMLADSRSFLSFPRHEYFRRLLCNLFGEEIEKGELPDDFAWIGKIIKDICYYNAKNYFRC